MRVPWTARSSNLPILKEINPEYSLEALMLKLKLQYFWSLDAKSQLFVTSWTAACQAPLFFTVSWSLCKFMSIESVMLSSHLILCHPLILLPSIFLSIRVFSNESALHIRWPNIGTSASASVLPMNILGLFHLRKTDLILISLLSEDSRVFSNITVQRHQFFSAQLSLSSKSHIHT